MSESMQSAAPTEPLTLSQKAFRALFGKRMAAFEGIPGPTPSLLAGNALELLRRPAWEVFTEYGERYGELCVHDPSRWLNGVKEANPLGSGDFFPFGRGRRACVGGPLGLLNIKLMVASILASCRPEVGRGQSYDSTLFFGTMFPKEMKAQFHAL